MSMLIADLTWGSFFRAMAVAAVVALVLAVIGMALVARRLRRIQLPPDAGVIETLRAVPLGLVVTLDLLDFSLDFLSAPITWAFLGRFGLQRLRQVTTLEAIIPGTQLIPTMTLAWLFARMGAPALPAARAHDQATVIDHEPSSHRR